VRECVTATPYEAQRQIWTGRVRIEGRSPVIFWDIFGIYADADRNVANGFILSSTEMLKWESRLAPLFFYATVAVLKQSPMLKKRRTERNSVRDSLEL
jgi:hypothetical protein